MKFRCDICGGEYQDTMPDGTHYFHACPDIPGRRDENPPSDVMYVAGKPVRVPSATIASAGAPPEAVELPAAARARGRTEISS